MADPLTLDILTLEEARSGLNLGATDMEHTAELVRLISSASKLLDEHFGPMVEREVTETHNPSGATIRLKKPPVASITSVTLDGVLLDSSAYAVEEGEYLARLAGSRYTYWHGVNARGLVVVYRAGRMATTTADDLVARHCKQGALLQLQHMWRPFQHSAGEVNEFDTGAIAANTQGLARGLMDHFIGEARHGIA